MPGACRCDPLRRGCANSCPNYTPPSIGPRSSLPKPPKPYNRISCLVHRISVHVHGSCHSERSEAATQRTKSARPSCVSRTRNLNRYPPCWSRAVASRCSSAICNAATVFCPRDDHDPVNDTRDDANIHKRPIIPASARLSRSSDPMSDTPTGEG